MLWLSKHVEFHLWLLTKAGIHLPAQRKVWHHSKNFESEFSCDEIALNYRTNFPVYTALSSGCSGLHSKLLQLCRFLEIPKHARCWQYCPVIHEAGKHLTRSHSYNTFKSSFTLQFAPCASVLQVCNFPHDSDPFLSRGHESRFKWWLVYFRHRGHRCLGSVVIFDFEGCETHPG